MIEMLRYRKPFCPLIVSEPNSIVSSIKAILLFLKKPNKNSNNHRHIFLRQSNTLFKN